MGKLYRDVSCKAYYDKCIKAEHEFSILLKYHINKKIINPNDKTFHKLLRDAFKVTENMTQKLKDIMVENWICNEAELFCSDFSFKLTDEEGKKYIGDASKKTEDVI